MQCQLLDQKWGSQDGQSLAKYTQCFEKTKWVKRMMFTTRIKTGKMNLFSTLKTITQNFTINKFDQLSILMSHVKCVVVFMAQIK